MKSGKYTLGYKTVLKTLRSSKGNIMIFAILFGFLFLWVFSFDVVDWLKFF